MKRLLVLLLCLAAVQAFANPLVAPPAAAISELYFDSNGKWFLELEFFRPVDTVSIITDSGESFFLSKNSSNEHFIVLTNDSLNNHSLTINKKSDCLKVVTRLTPSWMEKDSIHLGIRPNSKVDSIPAGCSINKNWFGNVICFDNSPTLGKANDEVGTTGVIYGHFYQLGAYLEANPKKYFYFPELVNMSTDLWSLGYPIDKNGNFSTHVRTGQYSIDMLLFFTQSNMDVDYKTLETNVFSVYPGDSLRVDFKTMTSLKNPLNSALLFTNYPNPANDKTTFFFDKPLNRPNEVFIKLFTMDGKLLQTLQSTSGVCDFDCRSLSTGMYVCKMVHSGKTVASTKLLIVR